MRADYRVWWLFVLLGFALPAAAQRLPTGVEPTHYDFTVTPDLASATFNGTETIDVEIARPIRTITLNAAEIRFNDVTIRSGSRTQTAAVRLDDAREQATFSISEPLATGPATIRISYSGILNNQLRGLYLSKANNRPYAVTQLEATDARLMFPCFDEPAFKATFALKAVIDAGDHAISNGAVLSDTPGPASGKHTVVFETTPKMSTYLVALAVGDFECIAGSADDVPIRICSTPDKKPLTGFALESAQQIMRYYNRYYAIKYPFKKLDVVAVPDFSAGAMENTAAIFYRETLLLSDPESSSIEVRKSIAQVLAHEMAHQWFGDLVTMYWWNDIWLNEGFANWMETKPLKAWKPEWHFELDEVQANQTAMNVDSLRSTRPIRANASTPDEINELFDPIAYEKGAAVLRMIESWLGEEAFRQGVNAYIERFKYRNARAEDFWTTLAQATEKPVDAVMRSFVEQPGVPLVVADAKCAGRMGSVDLSQRRYQRDPSVPVPSETWQVPICVRTASGQTRCDVIAQKTATIALDSCPAWVMANSGARGYYRTGYAPEMVRRMAAAVTSLSASERIALLSDEWALARATLHDVGTVLDLAAAFARERTAAVVATLGNILDALGDELAMGAARDRYRSWLIALLRPALEDVGWIASPDEPEDRHATRATLVHTLGATARDPAVLAKAAELVRQELAKPGSVEPTLLNVVAQLAPLQGDTALYNAYVLRSKSATDPEERYRYLYALAAFSDPVLIRRTMEMALGPDVRSQDTKLLIAAMLTNPEARDLAWQLVQARWGDVQKKTGEFVGNTVVIGALQTFCDARTAGEIEAFFASHPVPDAERTLQQSIERITSCARFADAQREKLTAWLNARQH